MLHVRDRRRFGPHPGTRLLKGAMDTADAKWRAIALGDGDAVVCRTEEITTIGPVVSGTATVLVTSDTTLGAVLDGVAMTVPKGHVLTVYPYHYEADPAVDPKDEIKAALDADDLDEAKRLLDAEVAAKAVSP